MLDVGSQAPSSRILVVQQGVCVRSIERMEGALLRGTEQFCESSCLPALLSWSNAWR